MTEIWIVTCICAFVIGFAAGVRAQKESEAGDSREAGRPTTEG